jgi:hypothetical protein
MAAKHPYSFNFGQSIADNNEGNPLNQFKFHPDDSLQSLDDIEKLKQNPCISSMKTVND